MPVNLVPVEGYTIRLNEKLMKLADGKIIEIAVYKLRKQARNSQHSKE
jgi:hypothetical protein